MHLFEDNIIFPVSAAEVLFNFYLKQKQRFSVWSFTENACLVPLHQKIWSRYSKWNKLKISKELYLSKYNKEEAELFAGCSLVVTFCSLLVSINVHMDLMSNMNEWVPNQREPRQNDTRTLRNYDPWETWFFQIGSDELFTGEWVSCCWVPKRDDAGLSEVCMPRSKALKNGHLPERKDWALYRMVSERCWVPKKDDAGNEKNDYKTKEI